MSAFGQFLFLDSRKSQNITTVGLQTEGEIEE